jgi:hypothetical protein
LKLSFFQGGSLVSNIFLPILTETQIRAGFTFSCTAILGCCEQIIALFLIVLRVADRTALTND